MGLKRRLFTKEFELAAVRRLEQGAAIAEVARALEVSANLLHRWRRAFCKHPFNNCPGQGTRSPAPDGRIEQERMLQALPGIHGLPQDGRRNASLAGTNAGTHGGTGQDQPAWLLPFSGRVQAKIGCRYGVARFRPAYRAGMAELWAAAHYGGAAPARLGGKPEVRVSPHARGQSAVRAQAQVLGDDGLQPRTQGVSQFWRGIWCRPA